MRNYLLSIVLLCSTIMVSAQTENQKTRIVEDGGTGPYKAVMQEERTLKAHTMEISSWRRLRA